MEVGEEDVGRAPGAGTAICLAAAPVVVTPEGRPCGCLLLLLLLLLCLITSWAARRRR
jgi:hypothetical protein